MVFKTVSSVGKTDRQTDSWMYSVVREREKGCTV